MKDPQPTKEQLAVELEVIKQSKTELLTDDMRRRKEFAKAFNWVKNAEYALGSNHIYKEPQLPSWEQIFVHIGRLLVAQESQTHAKEVMEFIAKTLPIQK